MQELSKLTNLERGKLLYALFPDEVPHLIDVVKHTASKTIKQQAKLRKDWTGTEMTFDEWLNIATNIVDAIGKYPAISMRNKSRLTTVINYCFYDKTSWFTFMCVLQIGLSTENFQYKATIAAILNNNYWDKTTKIKTTKK
jgi:hypothetical protein